MVCDAATTARGLGAIVGRTAKERPTDWCSRWVNGSLSGRWRITEMPTSHTDRVARDFEQNWTRYDEQIRVAIPYYDRMLETIVRLVGQRRGPVTKILDLGIGTGNLSHALLSAYPAARLTGVDLVADYIALAEARLATHGENVVLHHGDITEFDLEPGCYDLVVTSFVFHHLRDEDKRLLYARVLASMTEGGLFLNADFVDSASGFWSAAFDAVRVDHLRESGWSDDEITTKYLDHRKLEIPVPMETQLDWLRQLGFKDVECFWKYLNLALFGGRRS
jgi:tRNA (cmo5U34)-methyltransferase